MKRVFLTLMGISLTMVLVAQTPGSRIVLSRGQKILVTTTVFINTNMAPGMEATSSSTSENSLEVKQATDKFYILNSILTKLKLNAEMPGNSTAYDSEKKGDNDSEIGKSLSEKLNKVTEITIDNATGKALNTIKSDPKIGMDESNPMQSMMQMFGDNSSDEAIVSGAFQLIPQGKKVGDSWSDSVNEKNMKVMRNYTFRSREDSGAMVQLRTTIESTGTMEAMGMNMDVNTITQTTSDILVDIATGIVKRKTTDANITGSFQLMGQSVPISAKATTTSIYR